VSALALGGDLELFRLGLGAMRITGPGAWGEPADPDSARRLLRHAVEAGIELIDTADSYGPGVSESLIAEALAPYPEQLVIATKGGVERPGPGVAQPNARPERLRQCCEDSLRRLGLERIDLYQLHAVDPKVPIEDSVHALVELQEEGKVRHIGLCNVTVEELDRARELATVVSVQNPYNVSDRRYEDVLRACERDQLGFLPRFPLGTGELARPGSALEGIVRRHSATAAQLALAWLLHHSPVTFPILGTSSIAHLDENLEAATLELDEEEIEALDALAPAA
jgi:pyridoxine 4-dehydrogenase